MAGLASRMSRANGVIAAARQRATPVTKTQARDPILDRQDQLRPRLELVLAHIYREHPDQESMSIELQECLDMWSGDEYFDGAIKWLDSEIQENNLYRPQDAVSIRLGDTHSDPDDRRFVYDISSKAPPQDRKEILAAYSAIYDAVGRPTANLWIRTKVETGVDHDGLAAQYASASKAEPVAAPARQPRRSR